MSQWSITTSSVGNSIIAPSTLSEATTSGTTTVSAPVSNTISGTTMATGLRGYDIALEAVFFKHLAPHGWKLLHGAEKGLLLFSDVALVCGSCDEILISQGFGIGSIGDHTIRLMVEEANQRLEKHNTECSAGAEDDE